MDGWGGALNAIASPEATLSSPANLAEINVLFTSAGRRVELLRAFRRAYEELGLRGRILVADIDPLAPAHQVADASFIAPRLEDPQYVSSLAELIRDEGVHLVFPLIDPDVHVLAFHREDLERSGARVMVLDREPTEAVSDKWKTQALFRDLGLATPRSWLPGEVNPNHLQYPLFIKPRFGSAGKGAARVEDARQLVQQVAQVEAPIIQEFLPGAEITSDVFCSAGGEVWAVVSRQRIEVRWGEVAKGVTVSDPRIWEGCRTIAQGLRARGPITVQCMLRGGEPLFTEINARFAGGSPLAFAAGVPAPRWYLEEAAGRPVATPPIGTYRAGLYMTRFDDSFFLDSEMYARIDGRHLRPG
jgi:carbamoyl-phosphate synthase large subunit